MEVPQWAAQHQVCKLGLCFCALHCSPYNRLSRNILRETCLYIGNAPFFPVLFLDSLRLFNLANLTLIKEIRLETRFPLLTQYCMLSEEEVICVHEGGVHSLHLLEMELLTLPPMSISRYKPGLTALKGVLYVFGGRGTTSNEKLTCHRWANLACSKTRFAFSPAVHLDDVYLWFNELGRDGIEQFNSQTETFQLFTELPCFCMNLSNSILLVNDQEILFLTIKGEIYRKKHQNAQHAIIKANFCAMGWSRTEASPVSYNNKLYWTSYGNLIELNAEKETIREVYHNKES